MRQAPGDGGADLRRSAVRGSASGPSARRRAGRPRLRRRRSTPPRRDRAGGPRRRRPAPRRGRGGRGRATRTGAAPGRPPPRRSPSRRSRPGPRRGRPRTGCARASRRARPAGGGRPAPRPVAAPARRDGARPIGPGRASGGRRRGAGRRAPDRGRAQRLEPAPRQRLDLAEAGQDAGARADRLLVFERPVQRGQRGEGGAEPRRGGGRSASACPGSQGATSQSLPDRSRIVRPSSPGRGAGTNPRADARSSQRWTRSKASRSGPSGGQARATRRPRPERNRQSRAPLDPPALPRGSGPASGRAIAG